MSVKSVGKVGGSGRSHRIGQACRSPLPVGLRSKQITIIEKNTLQMVREISSTVKHVKLPIAHSLWHGISELCELVNLVLV